MLCQHSRQFQRGDRVISLSYYPPEFLIGMGGTIGSPYYGPLYAVRLSNGQLYRWFAGFELDSVRPERKRLKEGDFAIINQTNGHRAGEVGMRVLIVKAIEDVSFYDVYLDAGPYHRWVTWFDITESGYFPLDSPR
jgi:hypothetical protein